MGKWKVTILDTVSGAVAEAAFLLKQRAYHKQPKNLNQKLLNFALVGILQKKSTLLLCLVCGQSRQARDQQQEL